MTVRLTETLSLARTDSNTPDTGGIPSNRMILETTSPVKANVVMDNVGTSAIPIDLGDTIEDGLTYLKVRSTTAIVQYGLYISSVFYPLAEITSDMGYVKLGIVPLSSSLYLKSDTAATEVEIMVHKIVEPSES